jgi:hypothetical protein
MIIQMFKSSANEKILFQLEIKVANCSEYELFKIQNYLSICENKRS